jgi:hypothetical protein
MQARLQSPTKIKIAFNTLVLLSALFIFIPKAHAVYPCAPGFHYAIHAGCIANYYSTGVINTTIVPVGYVNRNTTVYRAGYNGVRHYNYGGADYYHRNWGGGAYHRR